MSAFSTKEPSSFYVQIYLTLHFWKFAQMCALYFKLCRNHDITSHSHVPCSLQCTFYKQIFCLYHINGPIQHMQALPVYIGTDRRQMMGHQALLLWHIARDLLHTVSHRHDNTWYCLCWISQYPWLESVTCSWEVSCRYGSKPKKQINLWKCDHANTYMLALFSHFPIPCHVLWSHPMVQL